MLVIAPDGDQIWGKNWRRLLSKHHPSPTPASEKTAGQVFSASFSHGKHAPSMSFPVVRALLCFHSLPNVGKLGSHQEREEKKILNIKPSTAVCCSDRLFVFLLNWLPRKENMTRRTFPVRPGQVLVPRAANAYFFGIGHHFLL